MTALRPLLTQALKKAEAARRQFIQPYSGYDATASFFEARGFAQGVAAAIEALEAPEPSPGTSLFDAGLPDPSRASVLISHYSPNTSQKAAHLALPRTGVNRRRVLDYIAVRCQIDPWKGATDEELMTGLHLSGNAARPRRYQLVKDGWLVDSGRKRKGSSGAEATVWVMSEAGKREWVKH